jgi:hypothetical protein
MLIGAAPAVVALFLMPWTKNVYVPFNSLSFAPGEDANWSAEFNVSVVDAELLLLVESATVTLMTSGPDWLGVPLIDPPEFSARPALVRIVVLVVDHV